MEFLLIGDSKLKILMDAGEMKSYKLDSVYADSCDSGFRRSFFRILERAKEKVGFDVGGDKVLIQFYPIEGGGCEIFVTKLGLLSDASARVVSRSDKVTMLSRKRGIYAFSELDDVKRACRMIGEKCRGETPLCDAFFDGHRYYLSIDEYGKGGEAMEFPFIIEYGASLPSELGSFVSEHIDVIAKGDAVKRFSDI